MPDENKTSPRLWATVTILVAVIGCIGAIVGPTLPELFKAIKGQEVSPTATQLMYGSTPNFSSINTLGPSVTATNTVPTDNSLLPMTSAEPGSGIIFVEKFEDNTNDWSLSGSTRLSQGELAITLDKGEWDRLRLPNVKVEGDFYIQAEMLLSEGHACFSAMGFALGKADVSQDSFLFSSFGCSGGRVGFYENNSEVFSTLIPDLWLQPNVTYIIGLESKNGLYTFYIDGKNIDSTALSPKGNDIGVYLRTLPGNKATFFVDNLVLTDKR